MKATTISSKNGFSTTSQFAAAALAISGGYGDAGGYLVAHSFSGHVTGNMVLAAIAFSPLAFIYHLPQAASLFLVCLCLAMGLQNGVYSKAENVSVHTTYMTGTVTTLLSSLVKQNSRFSAEKEVSAARHSVSVIVKLWAYFLLGAIAAGLTIPSWGAKGIWGLELPLLLAMLAEGRAA